jgi:hypothetical protein
MSKFNVLVIACGTKNDDEEIKRIIEFAKYILKLENSKNEQV